MASDSKPAAWQCAGMRRNAGWRRKGDSGKGACASRKYGVAALLQFGQ